MKILFIVGSTRKNSFNKQLAAMAEKMLAGKADVSYLSYLDIPLMNQDIEFPAPAAITAVREAINEADALWFFTPEYNGSYPGVLKNVIDWLSRPLRPNGYADGTPLTNKKAAISGVGGRPATAGARAKLAELLTFTGVQLLDKSTGFVANPEAWGDDHLVLSPEDLDILRRQAEALTAFIDA